MPAQRVSKRYTSRKDLDAILGRQDHKCPCGAILEPGNYDIDHSIALVFGGLDVLSNKVALCKPCHREKTFGNAATSAGSDLHMAAKIKRLRNPKPSRRPMQLSGRKIPSRPFSKRASQRQ
jgi:hypothetical protein